MRRIIKGVQSIHTARDEKLERLGMPSNQWERASQKFCMFDGQIDFATTFRSWLSEGFSFGNPDRGIDHILPREEKLYLLHNLESTLKHFGYQDNSKRKYTVMAMATSLQADYGNLVTAVALASYNPMLHQLAAKHLIALEKQSKAKNKW